MCTCSRHGVIWHCGIHAGVSDKYKTSVHSCAADQCAPEQEVWSDHTHHATWQPHGTEPCAVSGDHVGSSGGPDMMCDDIHSTPQHLSGKPVLAIAIGEAYCPGKVIAMRQCQNALMRLLSTTSGLSQGKRDGCMHAWVHS